MMSTAKKLPAVSKTAKASASAKSTKDNGIQELWLAYSKNRDNRLRNRLIEHYIDLPRRYAEHLKSRLPNNIDVNDLIAAARIGLLDAVIRFNPDRGVKFETFCAQRINGAMFDELRKMDWVPRTIRQFISRFEKAQNHLIMELGRQPADEEVADYLEISIERYRLNMKEINPRAQISFDCQAVTDEDSSDMMLFNRLVDSREPSPLDVAQRKEFLASAMRGLSASERTVLYRYYIEHATMKEIGDELGVSESRVCQINASILNFLRQKFDGKQSMLL